MNYPLYPNLGLWILSHDEISNAAIRENVGKHYLSNFKELESSNCKSHVFKELELLSLITHTHNVRAMNSAMNTLFLLFFNGVWYSSCYYIHLTE